MMSLFSPKSVLKFSVLLRLVFEKVTNELLRKTLKKVDGRRINATKGLEATKANTSKS